MDQVKSNWNDLSCDDKDKYILQAEYLIKHGFTNNRTPVELAKEIYKKVNNFSVIN